jgi:hypothetical protein
MATGDPPTETGRGRSGGEGMGSDLQWEVYAAAKTI